MEGTLAKLATRLDSLEKSMQRVQVEVMGKLSCIEKLVQAKAVEVAMDLDEEMIVCFRRALVAAGMIFPSASLAAESPPSPVTPPQKGGRIAEPEMELSPARCQAFHIGSDSGDLWDEASELLPTQDDWEMQDNVVEDAIPLSSVSDHLHAVGCEAVAGIGVGLNVEDNVKVEEAEVGSEDVAVPQDQFSIDGMKVGEVWRFVDGQAVHKLQYGSGTRYCQDSHVRILRIGRSDGHCHGWLFVEPAHKPEERRIAEDCRGYTRREFIDFFGADQGASFWTSAPPVVFETFGWLNPVGLEGQLIIGKVDGFVGT